MNKVLRKGFRAADRIRKCLHDAKPYWLPTSTDEWHFHSIRNTHLGESCFILGAGLSMKVEYLDLLGNHFTFAFNKVYRLLGQTSWRPSCYMIIDATIVESIRDELLGSEIQTIYAGENIRSALGRHTKIRYFPRNFLQRKEDIPEFQTDLRMGPINACYTVTYDAFQLAWHMGFRKFHTLGIDCKYDIKSIEDSQPIYDGMNVGKVDAGSSYFHADMFRKGEKMVLPDVEMQAKAHFAARRFIEANGGEIYNVAPDSPMEIFERRKLMEVLDSLK
jgi:hypothetical protein